MIEKLVSLKNTQIFTFFFFEDRRISEQNMLYNIPRLLKLTRSSLFDHFSVSFNVKNTHYPVGNGVYIIAYQWVPVIVSIIADVDVIIEQYLFNTRSLIIELIRLIIYWAPCQILFNLIFQLQRCHP